MLLAEGCSLAVYDPAAMPRAMEVLPAGNRLRYVDNSYEAAEDADALVILTDWVEFAELELSHLNQSLRYPIVIDGRNLYKPELMSEHGFTYFSVGRATAYPVREQKPVMLQTR